LGVTRRYNGLNNLVTGFPLSTVQKGIDANEAGFFVPVLNIYANQLLESAARMNDRWVLAAR
jgi:hypothetical protein